MTDTSGPTTPAGWYPDPAGSGHLRWWDGTAWTAHLAPQPTPAPAVVPVPTPVVQAPVIQPPVFAPVETVAAATPDNQQYVPFQGAWNANGQGSWAGAPAGDFAQPAQWNTPGAWALAFSSLFLFIAEFVFLVVAGVGDLTPLEAGIRVGISLLVFVVSVFLASADKRKLQSLGYLSTASIWWTLLGPLFYLIFRGVAVSREVRRGFGPLITYIIVTVVGALLFTLGVVALVVANGGGATSSAAFAASLQTGLDDKGGHYTVTCPPIISEVVGTTFSCTAIDTATNVSHTLTIQVVTGTDGKPTVKLVSVAPPIAG